MPSAILLLPSRNCNPKSSRIKTKRSKASLFRISHGERTRKNTNEESTTPAIDGRPRRYLCRHTQRPQNGRKASIAGFARAPTPHNTPNSVHPRQPGHCCSSRESQKINASINGVKVVSQIQCTDQYET